MRMDDKELERTIDMMQETPDEFPTMLDALLELRQFRIAASPALSPVAQRRRAAELRHGLGPHVAGGLR